MVQRGRLYEWQASYQERGSLKSIQNRQGRSVSQRRNYYFEGNRLEMIKNFVGNFPYYELLFFVVRHSFRNPLFDLRNARLVARVRGQKLGRFASLLKLRHTLPKPHGYGRIIAGLRH